MYLGFFGVNWEKIHEKIMAVLGVTGKPRTAEELERIAPAAVFIPYVVYLNREHLKRLQMTACKVAWRGGGGTHFPVAELGSFEVFNQTS